MQPVDGGPIKIGHSADVDARIQQLEAHYGCPLALLATLPGGEEEEAAIHARFDHLRFGRTEQFRPALDLMAFIGRPLLVDPNPHAVEVMPGRRSLYLSSAASDEWIAWVKKGAEFCCTDVSKLVDAALTSYLKAQGYPDPRPKRVP